MSLAAPRAITIEARKELARLLAEFKKGYKKAAIPAFLWIDSELNQGSIDSGIGIGYYLDRSEIEKDIEIVDGLEFAFAMSDEDKARFTGRVIDFKNGWFVLS